MRIHLDADLCCGYGNCVFYADDIVTLDDEAGVARLLRTEVPTDREAAVREAALDCPVSAIALSHS